MSKEIFDVYICSAGHSGSTLLDLLLGSHSSIASLGEIEHLSKNISLNTLCTCGKKVQSCDLWQEVIANASGKLNVDINQFPYQLNMGFPDPQVIKDKIHTTLKYQIKRRYFRGLQYFSLRYDLYFLSPFLKKVAESIDHTLMVYEVVRKILGCNVIIDSSKTYMRAAGFYRRNPDKVKIILLTRDGRGVAYSNIKRNFSRSKSIKGWKRYYARSTQLFGHVIADDHILQVKYEDLVNNPEAELQRICSFLNLEFEPAMMDFASHTHHITNGNNMRFKKSSEIKIDNAWKTELSKEDLNYFEKHAGDINNHLGYR